MTKKECEIILKEMRQIIKNYGFVTRADYYDLIGLDVRSGDDKVGWHSILGARIHMVKNEYGRWYELILPEPVDLH